MNTKWNRQVISGAMVGVVLLFGLLGCAGNKAAVTEKADDTNVRQTAALITDVRIEGDANGTEVTVQGNRVLEYAKVKSPFGNGIVLYFAGTKLHEVLPEYRSDDYLVEKVTTSQSPTEPPAARVEVVLRENAAYQVVQDGAEVRILVGDKAQGGQGGPVSSQDPMQPPEQAPLFDVIEPAVAAAQGDAAPSAVQPEGASETTGWTESPALLREIHFIEEEGGRSTIRIETTQPVGYKVTKTRDRRLLVEIPNVDIPREQRRPLITTRFDSAVDRILPIARPDGVAVISVELREAVPYHVQQAGPEIFMRLEASNIPPRPLAEAGLPPWEEAMNQVMTQWEDRLEEYDERDEVEADLADKKRFTGEKIALEFYQSDIKNVFQILKEVSGLNFAIDSDVTGEVTLSLHRPVPWDQVLDLILRMNDLGMEREGDIVRIANQTTLSAEQTSRQLEKEAELAAMEAQKELEPVHTEYIPVNYSTAASMKAHVDEIKTDERGKVTIDERTNTIIMTDTREKIRMARDIVSRLDKVTPQVTIEARIVEASSSFSRQIGIQWNGETGVQPNDARYGIGPQRGFDALGGTYGYNWNVNFPVASNNNSIGFNFARLTGLTPLVINATLTAMESRGEGRIISNPRIVTLDNKTATIKQGIDYPYQSVEDGEVNVEFKEVDLKLEVTPHVTQDHRVAMQISTTKNDLGDIILGRQSFTTKEAKTELLVNDGDTVVIGGIIKTTQRSSNEGWPWISRVPVLGWLFQNDSVTDMREELLIFITPKIVDLDAR
ncbi:MAG: type IV pilus secretin PilQ [Desulfatibacillaceae bacterium]